MAAGPPCRHSRPSVTSTLLGDHGFPRARTYCLPARGAPRPRTGLRLNGLMVWTPTYGDLRVDGEMLRRRLGEIIVSTDLVEALVRDIRGWQLRCATAVAVRNPKVAATFRIETGPTQRLFGDDWLPKPGWHTELSQSLEAWLQAIERVRRIELAARRLSPKRLHL